MFELIKTKKHIEQYLLEVASGAAKGTHVFFLGIGGIGMSALARYFTSKGVVVSGYDKTATGLTKQLQEEGIRIHFEDSIELLDKDADCVIYTPAIPKDHQELNYYLNHDYAVLKRSEILGLITNASYGICVAGTHGKTTTSTMIAHILKDSGLGCNAFLGGISSNYQTNFWSSEQNLCVIEADEYDRSFLKLNPSIGVITAMDPDHLDIYENEENFKKAFVDFGAKVKADGLLISKYGLREFENFNGASHLTYSINNNQASCSAYNIGIKEGSYFFDVKIGEKVIPNVVLNMGGEHNIENVLAAIVVADYLKIPEEKIKNAVFSFKGVKRRFEYVVKKDSIVMIDDYAHHPEELTALINGTKGLYKNRKCTIVFQPHLYSRTRDFLKGFAGALGLADEVLLLPIYPARELPIPGVESEMIMNAMDFKSVTCCNKEELLEIIKNKKKNNELDILITAGAGDIDALVPAIKNILNDF
jgi:UDP-N-acetylmuramate--alanine ligase